MTPRDPLEGVNANRHNLFSSSMSLPSLMLLLGMVFAYSAYSDFVAEKESDSAEDIVAHQLGVPRSEVSQVLSDGRVSMADGSIRRVS